MAETFYKNYLNKFEIGDDEENLLPIAGGIQNHDPSIEEDSEDIPYYDLNGGSETVTNSLTASYAFSGHRKYANPAQEYVRDKLFKLMERNCYFRVTEPDGRIIAGPATIKEIKPSGGDANNRADFEFTVTFVGIPTDTPAPTTPPSGE
jgi:hypothetical protein|nr:MAG TPA: tail tube protein [Caudoviricetes sp.]